MSDKNPITEAVRPYVEEIKKDAERGDHNAIEVIRAYQMHVACPSDPGAQGITLGALDEWKRRRAP